MYGTVLYKHVATKRIGTIIATRSFRSWKKWRTGLRIRITLKVQKHESFFLTFFAETETLWSQGPVTQDFWRDIRLLNISAHVQNAMKSVPRMLSMRWNSFSYAQCAIKFVPRMLSMDCTCKNCSHFTAGWACAEIRSSYAQCAMKFSKNTQKYQIKCKFWL